MTYYCGVTLQGSLQFWSNAGHVECNILAKTIRDNHQERETGREGEKGASTLERGNKRKRKEKREAGERMRGGRFGALEEKEEKEKEEEPSKSKRRPERVKKKKLIRKGNERLGGIGKKKD